MLCMAHCDLSPCDVTIIKESSHWFRLHGMAAKHIGFDFISNNTNTPIGRCLLNYYFYCIREKLKNLY